VSFAMPEYTGEVSGLGVPRLLEAIRRSGIQTKFHQASSSGTEVHRLQLHIFGEEGA
jgi:GDP-D-mannose dehydratase